MSAVSVMIVDDQPTFLRAMSAVVEETAGFAVVAEAASGEQAVAMTEALLPDLVLMDVNLPGIDGLEATRRLRRCSRRCSPPPVVMLLSTYDEDVGEGFMAECGAAAYVTKSAFGSDRLREVWAAAGA